MDVREARSLEASGSPPISGVIAGRLESSVRTRITQEMWDKMLGPQHRGMPRRFPIHRKNWQAATRSGRS
jgi:hypothetical protein